MVNLIFFVDMVVFAMVIACAASLLRGDPKRRRVFPHSDVVHTCVKQSEIKRTRGKQKPGNSFDVGHISSWKELERAIERSSTDFDCQ